MYFVGKSVKIYAKNWGAGEYVWVFCLFLCCASFPIKGVHLFSLSKRIFYRYQRCVKSLKELWKDKQTHMLEGPLQPQPTASLPAPTPARNCWQSSEQTFGLFCPCQSVPAKRVPCLFCFLSTAWFWIKVLHDDVINYITSLFWHLWFHFLI